MSVQSLQLLISLVLSIQGVRRAARWSRAPVFAQSSADVPELLELVLEAGGAVPAADLGQRRGELGRVDDPCRHLRRLALLAQGLSDCEPRHRIDHEPALVD